MKHRSTPTLGLALAPLLFLALPGCQIVGDIFKAGFWVGILAVAAVAVALGAAMALLGRRS